MMSKRRLSAIICLLTACGSYCFPQPHAAPDNKDTTALPGGRIGGSIRTYVDAVDTGDGARWKRILNAKGGELSEAKVLVGSGASPVGAKFWPDDTVNAKLADEFLLFSTAHRHLFTREGRLLTEGRIFEMSAGDPNRDGHPDIVVSDFLNPAREPWNDAGPLTTATPVIAEIPIETNRNKTVVPVTFGGRRLRLILDTGYTSDGILIFNRDKIDTDALGPSVAATIPGAGSGIGSNALVFEQVRFEVGEVAFTNQRAIVLADNLFKGFPNDGVIGYSLLGHYAVELDYDRSVMRLLDADRFAAQPGWEALPIYFKNNRIPWLDITIATREEQPVRLAAYIDFASSEALELLKRDANKFTLPAATKEKYLGRGLSGDIYGQEGTISRMRLGAHELTNVVVAIVPAAVRSRQDGADAVVGNNALRRFNVIFDYANRKLHIRPNSHFPEPFDELETMLRVWSFRAHLRYAARIGSSG